MNAAVAERVDEVIRDMHDDSLFELSDNERKIVEGELLNKLGIVDHRDKYPLVKKALFVASQNVSALMDSAKEMIGSSVNSHIEIEVLPSAGSSLYRIRTVDTQASPVVFNYEWAAKNSVGHIQLLEKVTQLCENLGITEARIQERGEMMSKYARIKRTWRQL